MGARRDKGQGGADVRRRAMEMLAALHLPGMRAAYDECARTAAHEELGCEEFLRMLLERETETREARRIERRLDFGDGVEELPLGGVPAGVGLIHRGAPTSRDCGSRAISAAARFRKSWRPPTKPPESMACDQV